MFSQTAEEQRGQVKSKQHPNQKGTFKTRSGKTDMDGGQPKRAARVDGGVEDNTHRTTAVEGYIVRESVWI